MGARRQQTGPQRQLELFAEPLSRGPGATGEGGTGPGAHGEQRVPTALSEGRALAQNLMERICRPANLNKAYQRVKANKGSPGVDGLCVHELGDWLRTNKDELIASLMDGSYKPQPIKRVDIPKPGGGMRQLGIPTTVDRVIQQAILQVLTPILDPTFSESSYGFRPGRGAHDALTQASRYVEQGRTIVVDCDLEKFFDRVNHDILMSRLARRIGDKRLLRIIRRFLTAGIMTNGVCVTRYEGTPQGGPLSPILANLLLDDLDKELERRGHCFCRYADDCNIYVQSPAAGERVMESITRFLETRLKLRVNRIKSAVAHVSERKFLGYRLHAEGRLVIAPQSMKRAKARIRELTRRNRSMPFDECIRKLNEFLTGWVTYFQLAIHRKQFRNLDAWIRRKLRCFRLKQCKRAFAIAKFLMERGVPEWSSWIMALSGKGWWRKSLTPQACHAMTNDWFDKQGLVNLNTRYLKLTSNGNRRGTEQVCPVV
ncbi:MAG: group II intron reverse transcriptase/maturase [Deltaproteobacteria bacterium]|nr:group II intron reverse transcriptase/maturase [Deltaproteobacteria bacterium]